MGSRLIASLMNQTRPATGSTEADGVLVERFIANRDERAFAALVHRHGPMVWALCRNALSSEADAEDAFQATFLTLVRRIRSIRNREVLGPWLHGTAVRICMKARRANRRRLDRETKVAKPTSATANSPEPWFDDVARVHRQIQLLPRREYEAFVLCVLEGVPQSEAARRLGVRLNSLSSLLARARHRLRARLKTEGATLALALAVAASAPAVVPLALARQTCRLATPAAVLSRSILSLTTSLTEDIMRKTLLLTAFVMTLGAAVTLGTFLAGRAEAQQPGQDWAALRWERAKGQTVQEQRAREVSHATPWEYKVVNRTIPSSIEPVLNELGNAGWELCSSNPVPDSNQVMFVFKRPKPTRIVAGEKIDRFTESDRRFGEAKRVYGEALEKAATAEVASPAQEATWEVIHLQRSSAETMRGVVNDFFKGKVTVDSRTNSLIIQGSAEDIKRIKKLIEHLDAAKESPGKGSR